ncbi:MAG: phospholipase D family protein [Gammaproteobacteria bacterium]
MLMLLALALALALAGCGHLPPGADYPRQYSTASAPDATSRLATRVGVLARAHGGLSGFRLVPVGVDGFLVRAQMIDAAEQTLDLQYYIFRADETGRLLGRALKRAALRGVRVRLLIDDGDPQGSAARIVALDKVPGIAVRIFNPFAYRGHSKVLRGAEYLLDHRRLDRRMHNKLLVVDNAAAMIGGRNVGNQYFQMDPESQFADDDVFVIGPTVSSLSATFDEFWNSPLAIPAAALANAPEAVTTGASAVTGTPAMASNYLGDLEDDGIDYGLALASGEPYAGMLSGRLDLQWARAEVLSDSPAKSAKDSADRGGRLLMPALIAALGAARSELVMVTPYFVPTAGELAVFSALRERKVRVRVLTNSLESSRGLLAHSGYMGHRPALLGKGVEINEIRSQLSSAHGSGQTSAMSAHGNYSLHAKLFVIDRRFLFVGSMNFDQRSIHLNTEIGLIIDSPVLAQQTVARFNAMTAPQNSYALSWRENRTGGAPDLLWRTNEAGRPVEYWQEPVRNAWDRYLARLLSWLPIKHEL